MKPKYIVFAIVFIATGLLWAQPSLTTASPDSGYQGAIVATMISGSGFMGPAPAPIADFGPGVTVDDVIYILSTLIQVRVTIDLHATTGFRDIIITNSDGQADTLFNGFKIINSDTLPPVITLVNPGCGDTIACADSAIIFDVDDVHGFIPASVQLDVNGTSYLISDPELTVVNDTLIRWDPAGPLPDSCHFTFVNIFDSLGTGHTTPPLECFFHVDTLGPWVDDMWPPPFGHTREFEPVISMKLFDDFAGFDTSSFRIRVSGIDYYWGDVSLEFDHDTLLWNAGDADVMFYEGDTVRVCIMELNDRVRGCGGPNPLQGDSLCWWFRIVVPPPLEISIRIGSINAEQFPYIKALCEVYDEEGRTIEHLTRNNFMVWERDGSFTREYPIIVQDLGGGGIADICFVIDDTGSMGGLITAVRAGVRAFTDSLTRSDINYRLGLVTFKDDVEFDTGYDLLGDVDEFLTYIDAIGISGGGDGREVSLDAIYDALDSLHWRPGTRIVIIMVTDYSPHWRGDGTAYSDVMPAEVIDHLLDFDALCFPVHVSSYMEVDTNFIHLAEATGGAWYDSSNFEVILSQIVEEIRGGYFVSWTSHDPIADCRVRDTRIFAAYPNIHNTDDPGYIDDFDVLDYHSPCSPEALIIEPLPGKFTSCSHQPIILSFEELEDGIDPASIQFVVDRSIFNYDTPGMTWADPYLRYDPSDADSFVHHSEHLVNLARVMDTQGHLPYHGPVVWKFKVDLVGPFASNPEPPDGAVLDDFQPTISFDITDDFAGVWTSSIIVAIDNNAIRHEFPPELIMIDSSSTGVHWNGRTFRFEPSEAGITFQQNDTVCVNIIRAVDKIDYCEPNPLDENGLVRWCFRIPDDDTLCPEFSMFMPQEDERLDAGVPFNLDCEIVDPSGVFDDETGSDGQGVYVWWDSDGDVEDGTYNEIQMENVGGDLFRTITMVPGQSENAEFVWKVFAYDNDFELDDPLDRTGCFSEIQWLIFGIGPVQTIIEPLPLNLATSTVPDQEIRILLEDEESPVDQATIILEVNGIEYTIDDPEMRFNVDTLVFRPAVDWSDGDSVYFELIAAKDIHGLPTQNRHGSRFFPDHSGPYVVPGSLSPEEDAITMDFEEPITMEIIDDLRIVDEESFVLMIGGNPVSSGDPGLYWDADRGILTYDPTEADVVWPNGDTVCVHLIHATDIEAEYGEPNDLQEGEFNWCFTVSVTSCGHSPSIFTPNGDGYNDVVVFTYPNQAFGNGVIKIFDTSYNRIWYSDHGATIWNGVDEVGDPAPGGLYLYSIEIDGESICSGSLTLLR